MLSLILSIVLWNVIIIALVVAIKFLKLAEINWSWLLIGLAVFSVYVFVNKVDLLVFLGMDISNVARQLNLDGKLTGLIVALLAIVFSCKSYALVNARSIGLTFRQNEKSVLPSLLLIAVAVVVTIVLSSMGKSGSGSDQSNFLTSITYPLLAGLDEELIYRGLLLVLFSLAVTNAGFKLFGARVSLGGLLALVLFAIIHGIKIKNGHLALSMFGVGLTFFYGFIFLWVRERTGSLLLPILSHNLINTISWLL